MQSKSLWYKTPSVYLFLWSLHSAYRHHGPCQVCSTRLVCGVPRKRVVVSRYMHLMLSYVSLRSQGAGSVFLISITNHRVPMSSTWLRSTSYHTSKSKVLLRSTILTSLNPRPTTTEPINPTPHSSTQDAPPNPLSHHPPHRPHSRIEPASATTSAE
jgi:hypothetical protein